MRRRDLKKFLARNRSCQNGAPGISVQKSGDDRDDREKEGYPHSPDGVTSMAWKVSEKARADWEEAQVVWKNRKTEWEETRREWEDVFKALSRQEDMEKDLGKWRDQDLPRQQ